jgi:hypothetical protein
VAGKKVGMKKTDVLLFSMSEQRRKARYILNDNKYAESSVEVYVIEDLITATF